MRASAFAYMLNVVSSAVFSDCLSVSVSVCAYMCAQHHLPPVKIPDSRSSPLQKQLISHPTSRLAARTMLSPGSHVFHTQTGNPQ